MYVQEAQWFKKQQRKTVWLKGVKYLVMCLILVLSVFIGMWCVPLNGKYFPVEVQSVNIPEQVLAQETIDSLFEQSENVSENKEDLMDDE